MQYPKLEQVKDAGHIQICKWHRFLKSPENSEQNAILKKIATRLKEFGGMSPSVSKLIGWDE